MFNSLKIFSQYRWLFIIGLLCSISGEAIAQQRVALVIGINNYNYCFSDLRNAVNDAEDIAKALKNYGFEVTLKTNLTLEQMNQTLRDFEKDLRKISGNGVGLFFFSGHGTKIEENNYLIPIIPVNTRCTSEEQLKSVAINATEVLDSMEKAGTRVNILILDACRDNFSYTYRTSVTHNTGLAKMNAPPPTQPLTFNKGRGPGGTMDENAPHGSIISLATAPGKKASDGPRNNGLYTENLLRVLQQNPGLTIEKVFKLTATEVAKASQYQQIPWTESSLLGNDFCFSNCQQPNPTPQPPITRPEPPPPSNRVWKEANQVFQDRLRDGGLGPEMVIIPTGRFRMGDIQGAGSRDEKPVHWVSVNEFAIGRYEVTVAEFRQFVQSTGYRTDAEKGQGCYTRKGRWGNVPEANWHNSYFSQQENHPVTCVSWNDAKAYTEWLSEQTGQPYTLPSEAQWEYAARASTESQYWWSNSIGYNQANCWKTSRWRDGTSPVGSFSANSFKVYDTTGNVMEWVADSWHNNYYGAPSNGEVWDEGGDSVKRVVRGGSWASQPPVCRVANRLKNSPTESQFKIGFRCGLKTVY